MKLHAACALSLVLLLVGCSSKAPSGQGASAPAKAKYLPGQSASAPAKAPSGQGASAPAKVKRPPASKSPGSALTKADQAKIWQQLLAQGTSPLRSLKGCSKQAGDKRTLFTYLAGVLGVVGAGMTTEHAKKARPEADYTLHFRCSTNMPDSSHSSCELNANDLDATGRLYVGLRFNVVTKTARLLPETISCVYF